MAGSLATKSLATDSHLINARKPAPDQTATPILVDTPPAPDQDGAMEKIISFLRQGVRSGRLVPGQHLVEPDLTRQLNCSRGTLRSAIMHLAAEGMITLSRYRGARVSILDRKSIEDLLDVLENIISFAGVLACKNIEIPENRAIIENAIAALRPYRTDGDNAGFLQKRQAFYDALVTASGNTELRHIMPTPRADLLRVQLMASRTSQNRKQHIDGYFAIAKAVLSGNVKKVERAVKQHVDSTRAALKEIPDEAFPHAD